MKGVTRFDEGIERVGVQDLSPQVYIVGGSVCKGGVDQLPMRMTRHASTHLHDPLLKRCWK